jgi:hypothetical protein
VLRCQYAEHVFAVRLIWRTHPAEVASGASLSIFAVTSDSLRVFTVQTVVPVRAAILWRMVPEVSAEHGHHYQSHWHLLRQWTL